MSLRDSKNPCLNPTLKVFLFLMSTIFLFSENTAFAAPCTEHIPQECTTEECIAEFCQAFDQELQQMREKAAAEHAASENLSEEEKELRFLKFEEQHKEAQREIRRLLEEIASKKQEGRLPITIEESRINDKDKSNTCDYLYEIYKKYVSEDCGQYNSLDEVCSTSCGESLGKDIYSNFRSIIKQSCRMRQLIKPESFRQEICLLENTNLENPTAKRFALCAAKAVILARLSEMRPKFTDNNKKRFSLSEAELLSLRTKYMNYRTATMRVIGAKDGSSVLAKAEELEAISSYDLTETGNYDAYAKTTRRSLSECELFYKANPATMNSPTMKRKIGQ